jgi:hypothetical protein
VFKVSTELGVKEVQLESLKEARSLENFFLFAKAKWKPNRIGNVHTVTQRLSILPYIYVDINSFNLFKLTFFVFIKSIPVLLQTYPEPTPGLLQAYSRPTPSVSVF